MDADLQHDEGLLPQMLETLKSGDFEIVVGSRYAPGGDIGNWDARRARMSRFAVRLSRVLVPAELTDPMSGFFMMHRSVLDGSVRALSAIGFKIRAASTKLSTSEPKIETNRNLSSGTSTPRISSRNAWAPGLARPTALM